MTSKKVDSEPQMTKAKAVTVAARMTADPATPGEFVALPVAGTKAHGVAIVGVGIGGQPSIKGWVA